jgi:hypothetical protein
LKKLLDGFLEAGLLGVAIIGFSMSFRVRITESSDKDELPLSLLFDISFVFLRVPGFTPKIGGFGMKDLL